jgi:hypothetical protein
MQIWHRKIKSKLFIKLTGFLLQSTYFVYFHAPHQKGTKGKEFLMYYLKYFSLRSNKFA